jgi:hypothetical protein
MTSYNGAYDGPRPFLQAVSSIRNFEAYNNPGLAHTELGEEEKATEAFRKASSDRRLRGQQPRLHHVQTEIT